jgi:hypothetical protein
MNRHLEVFPRDVSHFALTIKHLIILFNSVMQIDYLTVGSPSKTRHASPSKK